MALLDVDRWYIFFSMRTKKQLAEGAWEFWIECHSCGPFLSHFWASFHRSTVVIGDSAIAEFREPNLSFHNDLTKLQKSVCLQFPGWNQIGDNDICRWNLFTINEWFRFGHQTLDREYYWFKFRRPFPIHDMMPSTVIYFVSLSSDRVSPRDTYSVDWITTRARDTRRTWKRFINAPIVYWNCEIRHFLRIHCNLYNNPY